MNIKSQAIKRVVDKNNKTIGYIGEDEEFSSVGAIKRGYVGYGNLSVLSNGVVRCKGSKLPVVKYSSIMKRRYEQLVKENPFKRDIQKDFKEWKDNWSKEVLRVSGARQVGKTTEILKFAYENYDYIVYVDLSNIEGSRFIEIIEQLGVNIASLQEYCRRSRLLDYVDDSNTVLIIDEIQCDSGIYNNIRSFKSELQCDIIVSGSYLGATLNSEYFHPVDDLVILNMDTLSFAEFTDLFNCRNMLEHIDLFGKGKDTDYKKLDHCYDIYRQIGGYPEVVKEYIRTKDIKKSLQILEGLLRLFKNESGVYFKDTGDHLVFEYVYREAIKQICKEKVELGDRFIRKVTRISTSDYKLLVNRDEVLNAVVWLIYSRILGVCYMKESGDNLDMQSPKRIYFNDCGMMNLLGREIGVDEETINEKLTETFVFNELRRLYSEPFCSRKFRCDAPYFLKSLNGEKELHFLVIFDKGEEISIEVKSHKGNSLGERSIGREVIVKHIKGGTDENGFKTIPIYTIGARFPYEEKDNR